MVITANTTYYKQLNEEIRACPDKEIVVKDLYGQRYLGCGTSDRVFKLYGTPGNGLGQYNNGSTIEVFGNCQEAVGDTMNHGEIIIHGSCGDACGYGMRGGRIFIENNVGYRAGIHMKAYMDKFPVVVVGGKAGSFLGEYLAGGLIAVLGKGAEGKLPCGYFCGTGMHGGKIVLRCDEKPSGFPRQVLVREMNDDDRAELLPHITDFCKYFGGSPEEILAERFYVLTPNPEAGYKQLYTFE